MKRWPAAPLCWATTIVIFALPWSAGAEDPIPYLRIDINGHTAPVRALAFSADSTRLFTAGMDKVVHVWRLPPRAQQVPGEPGVVREHWIKERTLRWEVARGLRGSIYSLAVSPADGAVSIGGYGARGTTGEIIWIDPAVDRFERAEYEHRQSVVGLSYTPDGRWLASIDLSGKALLWGSRDARPQVIRPTDVEEFGQATAARIAQSLRFRPIAAVGNGLVVVPLFAGMAGANQVWQLGLYDIPQGRMVQTLATKHYGAVTALAASPDGRTFASADLARRLYLWQVTGNSARPRLLEERLPVISLAFGPRGGTLAAGTMVSPQTAEAELQVWDVGQGVIRHKQTLDENVHSCAVSPDGTMVAFASGNRTEVSIERLDAPGRIVQIAGGIRTGRIAFDDTEPGYRVVFEAIRFADEDQQVVTRRLFDPNTQLLLEDVPNAIETDDVAGWTARFDKPGHKLEVIQNGVARGFVALDSRLQGRGLVHCWIPGEGNAPFAVAIGTDLQNGVYVYRVVPQGPCPLLRHFRGHHDYVTGLDVSADGRYLVSASADGTIRIWSLKDLPRAGTVAGRWGAEIAVLQDLAVVTSVDDVGPLYHKGVRARDLIAEIQWQENGRTLTEARAEQIIRRLETLPFHTQVVFKTARDRKWQPGFQLLPAWHHLLALYTTETDWIAWTASGYYGCSPGGERLIGWQINNQIGEKPSFFPAVRFSKTLFRPKIIRLLLAEGSVKEALDKLAELEPPEKPQPKPDKPKPKPEPEPPKPVRQPEPDPVSGIVETLPPKVKIVAPAEPKVRLGLPQVRVTARSEAVGGRPIVSMRLLLDGRPYGELVRFDGPQNERLTAQASWQLDVNPGRHHIAVLADSEVSQGKSDEIELIYLSEEEEVKPSLYVLAVGISAYPDALALQFADKDALKVVSLFEQWSPAIFERVEVNPITNVQANRAAIEEGLKWLNEQMTTADVGVIFYSGHGLTDEAGKFCLLPIDGKPDDTASSCVSEETIARFCSQTPGRLLMIFDSCHSGAFDTQSMTGARLTDDLVRDLARDDYGVMMMASSRGREVSLEHPKWGGGAFTAALAAGLKGQADFDGDAHVWVNEVDLFVFQKVREMTRQQQTPVSAKPATLAPFALTRINLQAQRDDAGP